MTSRSFDSFASNREKRRSKRISDEDVIQYALRVAYLAYLMQPKIVDTTNGSSNSDARESKDYSSRIAGAVSNSIFSIGDLLKDVGRDGPKSVKFPEKLIKALENKLQAIAMAKEPNYSDQRIRRTVAIFYGQYTTEQFRRQIKDSRKIEDLILMFATTATGTLRKDPQLAGDQWKVELNNQIAQFVRMLRECLRTLTHVTPELTARLDLYTAKLAPQIAADSGYESSIASSSSRAGDSPSAISTNVYDMKLARVIAELTGMSDHDLQTEIDNLRRICSEKSALVDLKTCLKNINAGEPFPGCRQDFETEAAWQQWRTTELATLSQLMLVMVQLNPSLAKSTPSEVLPSTGGRPESMYTTSSTYDPPSRHVSITSRHSLAIPSGNPESIGAALQDDDEVQVGQNFTFIPPNPKRFYKRLVELCIQSDLEAMESLPPDVEVSLGILSVKHVELINECAVRWRIPHSYRAVCFLDIIKYKYEREEVPLDCIPEALQMMDKTLHEQSLDKWTRHEHDYLATVYHGLFDLFIAAVYHCLDTFPSLKPGEISRFLSIVETIRDSGFLERAEVDLTQPMAQLEERARALSTLFYTEKQHEHFQTTGVNRALPLLLLTDDIEKSAKLLDKRFPDPLLGQLDLISIFMECTVPMYLDDLETNKKRIMEGSKNLPHPDVPIEDIFSLYRRTKTIVQMFEDVCPKSQLHVDTTAFFEPFVLQWLATTDGRVTQWVQAAIQADKFEAEAAGGTSSSIIDLFDSIRSPLTFLEDLDWPDQYQSARFFTALSKTMSKAVELYCHDIEELFMEDMFPRPVEPTQPQRQNYIQKVRETIQIGEKKVEGFNFTSTSCVKLNNVEAARKLLDEMYTHAKADEVADYLKQNAPPIPAKKESQRFLFAVKIVLAEGLVPLDSSPSAKLDTFVTLSDEHGNRLAKTRTIYEQSDPRWEETFDITVEKPLWLMASIRDRALIGKHDTVGRAYICLDPKRYADFLTHDLWLDLDSSGRVLLRISMEGEQDDIQFYFGRAFRALKRCEGDMVRIFVDKMAPFIRQSISRNVLKMLVKSGPLAALDYNKAIDTVNAFYRSAIGNSSNDIQIPLPTSEKPRVREGELTDVEIEQAIAPLFGYLDVNLQVLNTSLDDTTKSMVMLRVWKEILIVIEGLLIPPLSAIESDMKPLSDKEVDIVFKWLQFLRSFFYADGEGPVPLEELQNQKYRDVVSIRLYYDWTTDALMEECVRMMQQSLRSAPTLRKKAKTVYNQRNLGTIKKKKTEKREAKKESTAESGDVIMRILRMRPRTSDFLSQQLSIIASIQSQAEQRGPAPQVLAKSGRGQSKRDTLNVVPPLPPLRSPPAS